MARQDYDWAIWAIAVGQTLGYGCLFYIFPALVSELDADLGWGAAALGAGPTIALILSGVLAPVIGRMVDAGWGVRLMAWGPVVGAIGLIVFATATSTIAYWTAWALLGLAQAAALYEVCFALLVRRLNDAARQAITKVTLVAGFASTIAFPVFGWIAIASTWRHAVWAALAVVICVMLPLHIWGTGRLARSTERTAAPNDETRVPVAKVLSRPIFWLISALFFLGAFVHWMLVSFIIPIFAALNIAQGMAIIAASCIGPAQVVGRLIFMRYETGLRTSVGTLWCYAASLCGLGLLALAGVAPWLIFAFALLQGGANGMMTILRPVLIAESMGRRGFGQVAGMIQVPSLIGSALGPMVGGLLLQTSGVAMIGVVAGACGVVAIFIAWRIVVAASLVET